MVNNKTQACFSVTIFIYGHINTEAADIDVIKFVLLKQLQQLILRFSWNYRSEIRVWVCCPAQTAGTTETRWGQRPQTSVWFYLVWHGVQQSVVRYKNVTIRNHPHVQSRQQELSLMFSTNQNRAHAHDHHWNKGFERLCELMEWK